MHPRDPRAGWRAVLQRHGVPLAASLPASAAAPMLVSRGERRAAEDAYGDILAAAPDDLVALEALSGLLRSRGRVDEAAALDTRAVAVETDRMGVAAEHRDEVIAFKLAARGLAPGPATAPSAYVSALFDGYADGFEESLVGTLRYRGHELVTEALARALPAAGALDVCDLGCGTGLVGAAIRPRARRLTGVDLAPKMIEASRARGVYDDLFVADVVTVLAASPGAYDVVTAADVLIYIGELGPAFGAAHTALRAGGHLVFTTERGDAPGSSLTTANRYAHAPAYVHASAATAGFAIVSEEDAILRYEYGHPVDGQTWVLERR